MDNVYVFHYIWQELFHSNTLHNPAAEKFSWTYFHRILNYLVIQFIHHQITLHQIKLVRQYKKSSNNRYSCREVSFTQKAYNYQYYKWNKIIKEHWAQTETFNANWQVITSNISPSDYMVSQCHLLTEKEFAFEYFAGMVSVINCAL